jgi:hypothetical protein
MVIQVEFTSILFFHSQTILNLNTKKTKPINIIKQIINKYLLILIIFIFLQ